MIIDGFIFAGYPPEFDLLRTRLYELRDVVDRHVIVEADHTHQGNPKPLFLTEHFGEFGRWANDNRCAPFIVIRVTDLPDPGGRASVAGHPGYQVREHAQREALLRGLDMHPERVGPDDILMVSDLDEIPDPTSVAELPALIERHERVTFIHDRYYCMAVDLRWPGPMTGLTATTVSRARDTGIQWLRAHRTECAQIEASGWHFSWLGDLSAKRTKLASVSDGEAFDRMHKLPALTAQGVDINGITLTRETIDATFPRWIQEGHLDHLKHDAIREAMHL